MTWDYGDAYKRYPADHGCEISLSDGSVLMVHDIFDGLPEHMRKANVIFTDGPWNIGNIRSFYTKAELPCPIRDFRDFYSQLFQHVGDVNPHTCYLEIGKEHLADYIIEMRRLYKYVTLYNTTYYHRHNNICYIVQGSRKRKNKHFDWIDEEDVISAIAKCEEYDVIGDFCMGRGLVAVAAAKAGRRFVGTELNHKRLSVCLGRLAAIGVMAI